MRPSRQPAVHLPSFWPSLGSCHEGSATAFSGRYRLRSRLPAIHASRTPLQPCPSPTCRSCLAAPPAGWRLCPPMCWGRPWSRGRLCRWARRAGGARRQRCSSAQVSACRPCAWACMGWACRLSLPWHASMPLACRMWRVLTSPGLHPDRQTPPCPCPLRARQDMERRQQWGHIVNIACAEEGSGMHAATKQAVCSMAHELR